MNLIISYFAENVNRHFPQTGYRPNVSGTVIFPRRLASRADLAEFCIAVIEQLLRRHRAELPDLIQQHTFERGADFTV